jgi:hypothetical protein
LARISTASSPLVAMARRAPGNSGAAGALGESSEPTTSSRLAVS